MAACGKRKELKELMVYILSIQLIALRHFLSCGFTFIASEHRRFTKRAHSSYFIRSDCLIKGKICSGYMLQRSLRTWRAREVVVLLHLAYFISFHFYRKDQTKWSQPYFQLLCLLLLNLGIRAVDNNFSNLTFCEHIYPWCLGAIR